MTSIIAAGPTIVFTRTRHGADRLAKQLDRAGVKTAAIHGGRSQNQRTRALDAFSKGNVWAMIATDVAARGIHVDGVACVVHFDPPEDDKTYLHRSGRTARAGAEGTVVCFVRPANREDVRVLQRDLGLPQAVTEPTPDVLGDGSLHVHTSPPGRVQSGRSRVRPSPPEVGRRRQPFARRPSGCAPHRCQPATSSGPGSRPPAPARVRRPGPAAGADTFRRRGGRSPTGAGLSRRRRSGASEP